VLARGQGCILDGCGLSLVALNGREEGREGGREGVREGGRAYLLLISLGHQLLLMQAEGAHGVVQTGGREGGREIRRKGGRKRC